jgi:hypothetical protein
MINNSYVIGSKYNLHDMNILLYLLNKFTEMYSLNETKLKLDNILNYVNDIKPYKQCWYGKYDYLDHLDDHFEKIFKYCYVFLLEDIHDALCNFNGKTYEPDLYAKYGEWKINNAHEIFLIDLDNITFNIFYSNSLINHLDEELDEKPEDLVIPIANWDKKRKRDDIL